MKKLLEFLKKSAIFRDLSQQDHELLVGLFEQHSFAAGEKILREGDASRRLYVLTTGELAVRVNRRSGRHTVAYLHPPALFGELSFITGRPCSADIDVTVDASVASLPRKALEQHSKLLQAILQGATTLLAERLHDTVVGGAEIAERPTIVLRSSASWKAPRAFARSLAESIGHQSRQSTVVVNLGAEAPGERWLAEGVKSVDYPIPQDRDSLRGRIAEDLSQWRTDFAYTILSPAHPLADSLFQELETFADYVGVLVGPEDQAPEQLKSPHFIVEDFENPTSSELSGRQQLIRNVLQAETESTENNPVNQEFKQTVDSIARHILDRQTAVVLGGGAAWGWAHIGVLSVLEESDFPIDVIAGSSMGSVMGALRACGRSREQMKELAAYWSARTRGFLEWRLWKLHLINEGKVRKMFSKIFGDTQVNRTQTPFWANTVDIQTGREVVLKDGPISDTLRRSISLPGLFPAVQNRNRLLVDSFVNNPVPVNLAQHMGCRFSIAINVMVPLEAREIARKHPWNLLDIMYRCMRVTAYEIGHVQSQNEAQVLMHPDLSEFSMLDFGKATEIIRAGEEIARQMLPAALNSYDTIKKENPRPRSAPAEDGRA